MALFDDMFSKLDEIFGSDAPPTILLSMHKQVLRTAEAIFIREASNGGPMPEFPVAAREKAVKRAIGDAEAFWKEALQSVKKSGDWVATPKKPIPDAEARELRLLINRIDLLNADTVSKLKLKVNALLDACGYAKDS